LPKPKVNHKAEKYAKEYAPPPKTVHVKTPGASRFWHYS